MSWLSLWFLHKVIQRKTLASLVVLGKKLEFYSWVSSISNFKPICESPVFWVRIFQHRSGIIFCYFCAEQMAMEALKELRHSQFCHCWVLLINRKDQNVTFHGVLMAVCVLKPTCLYNSALELEQFWLYPHTIWHSSSCSRLCKECLHPRLEKDTTHPLSRALPATWAPKTTAEGRKAVSREWQPPQRLCESPAGATWNRERVCGSMDWLLGMTGHKDAIPFTIKWTRCFVTVSKWQLGEGGWKGR